jgi:hypothetical protein
LCLALLHAYLRRCYTVYTSLLDRAAQPLSPPPWPACLPNCHQRQAAWWSCSLLAVTRATIAWPVRYQTPTKQTPPVQSMSRADCIHKTTFLTGLVSPSPITTAHTSACSFKYLIAALPNHLHPSIQPSIHSLHSRLSIATQQAYYCRYPSSSYIFDRSVLPNQPPTTNHISINHRQYALHRRLHRRPRGRCRCLSRRSGCHQRHQARLLCSLWLLPELQRRFPDPGRQRYSLIHQALPEQGTFFTELDSQSLSHANNYKQRQQADATKLEITLKDGVLMDTKDRTGYIAANHQFQFDDPPQTGAIYTAGWSACGNGSLALGGTTVFHQCLSGDFYNLYDQTTGDQCNEVHINIVKGTSGAASQLPDGQPQETPSVSAPYV